MLLYVLGFGFATIAAGLATAVSTWLALLITTVIVLAIAVVLGVFAKMKIEKGSPPVPEQAIREAKLTTGSLEERWPVTTTGHSTDVRREIESEREQLAGAAETLREEISEATNVGAKLRSNLPAVAVGALGAGFLLAGGVGATVRLIFRRGREGETKAKLGRFRIVDRD